MNTTLVSADRMEELCQGCAGYYDSKTKTIYSKMPESWDDYSRIHTLGHEFLHALGYSHEGKYVYGARQLLK